MSSEKAPKADLSGLSGWAPELAQTFVSLASDIALVLDDSGIIRSVAQAGTASLADAAGTWVGRRWADTVTGETRGKIDKLLDEVRSTGLARRREINHLTDQGGQLAYAYTAIRLGDNGPLLAVGRDLGAVAAIQQRFLSAQQEMERGYWRARHAEARYRMLFQVATDAVLVVDAETLNILESNQAASRLFELSVEQLAGRSASFGFERHSRQMLDELLARARSTGQPHEIRARLLGKVIATSVVATPIRTDDAMRLLVRIRTMDMPGSANELSATLARLVDGTSDGVVVTDSSGRIILANPAFLKLVDMNTEAAVKGRSLMDWIGVSEEQFTRMISQVRLLGITRRMSSRLLTAAARLSEIEISAALLTEGDQECIGFTIRSTDGQDAQQLNGTRNLKVIIDDLCSKVGQVPMPELLRMASSALERQLIHVALELSGEDVVAAAALLGVSQERLDLPPGEAPVGPGH